MNRGPQQVELFPASQIVERLGKSDRLWEMILERNNKILAWKQICANKGASGVGGMKTNQLGSYLGKHWTEIEQDLLNCRHKLGCLKTRFWALLFCSVFGPAKIG
ncbi:hypothetical protein [uncultured Desulfuromusa sp.]|uniref:hypothetical protein n=1 Tax=uncultured Desulfuromusa sp. TaxID=219183 RepID=UPI002AA6FCEB|nr:hypothetical protein [uncultured Desulfuromusa sp.]